jgi:hypothetical protein
MLDILGITSTQPCSPQFDKFSHGAGRCHGLAGSGSLGPDAGSESQGRRRRRQAQTTVSHWHSLGFTVTVTQYRTPAAAHRGAGPGAAGVTGASDWRLGASQSDSRPPGRRTQTAGSAVAGPGPGPRHSLSWPGATAGGRPGPAAAAGGRTRRRRPGRSGSGRRLGPSDRVPGTVTRTQSRAPGVTPAETEVTVWAGPAWPPPARGLGAGATRRRRAPRQVANK